MSTLHIIVTTLAVGLLGFFVFALVSDHYKTRSRKIAGLESSKGKLLELIAVRFCIDKEIKPAINFLKTGEQPGSGNIYARQFLDQLDAVGFVRFSAKRTGNAGLLKLSEHLYREFWDGASDVDLKATIDWFEYYVDGLALEADQASSAVNNDKEFAENTIDDITVRQLAAIEQLDKAAAARNQSATGTAADQLAAALAWVSAQEQVESLEANASRARTQLGIIGEDSAAAYADEREAETTEKLALFHAFQKARSLERVFRKKFTPATSEPVNTSGHS